MNQTLSRIGYDMGVICVECKFGLAAIKANHLA